MLDASAHRGPDGRGAWLDAGVALGHVRLAILDPTPAGHQPMRTPGDRGVLAYNGEVYNFRELRRELEKEGIDFRSQADTEVVLHALHLWGPERALPRFDGMFALAYWDGRSRSLWLARDRLGIKPLYLHRSAAGLLFASELRALLAHPRVATRPDVQALVAFVVAGRLYDTRTPFVGLEALEPGSWLRVREGEETEAVWYDPIEALDPGRLLANQERRVADWPAAFEALLRRSVDLHLVSDAPLATTCSGGVDSGLVTAFARERRPDLVAYVADQAGERSEGEAASRMAAQLGVELRPVRVDRDLFLRTWPRAAIAEEVPTGRASDVPRLLVASAAHSDGFKVLLTGEGADELFGGYDRHVLTRRQWQRALRRRWTSPRHWRDWPRRLARLTRTPTSMSPARNDAALERRLTLAVDPADRLRTRAIFARLAGVRSLPDRAFLADGLRDLGGNLRRLLHVHDRTAMAASVEMRVPYLENELVDFALHLPPRAKLHRGISKWAVKTVALRHLPRDLVLRPKQGFPTPEYFTAGTTALLADGFVADLLRWPRRHQAALLAEIEASPDERGRLVGLELWGRVSLAGASAEELGERLLAAGSAASARA